MLGVILLHDSLKYIYAYLIFGLEEYNAIPEDTRIWLIQVSALLLSLIATLIITSFDVRKATGLLGLDRGIALPFLAAVLCTSPMFIGYALTAQLRAGTTLYDIFTTAIWPGFNEELVFRAFIMGILVREAKWHFIPAALISALLFAKGHLYQAHSIGEAVSIFFFVSGAGIGFSLFYMYWNWNIWFTIFLHFLMNLSFNLYDVGSTALLNRSANIYRGITILLGIICTVIVQVRTQKKLMQQ